jgi:hypothetical protein
MIEPQGQKKAHFASCQEACMKNVELPFGVLQSRFADVRYYDMIIESEREDPLARDDR